MKKIYNVKWSETSEKDLIEIVEYIAGASLSQANEVFRQLKRKASGLHSFPDRGRIVPELQEQGITQYRELIVAPWRIIYRISQETIYVLAVFDSRRSVEDILFKRLIGLKL
jgi:toxin ParE1/3/4